MFIVTKFYKTEGRKGQKRFMSGRRFRTAKAAEKWAAKEIRRTDKLKMHVLEANLVKTVQLAVEVKKA